MTAVGDIQCSLDTGNAAANNKGTLGDRHGDSRQDAILLDPLHHHSDDLDGLDRGFFLIFVDPGTVFADVGHLAEKRIQAGCFDCFAKGPLVHARRAGRHDHMGQLLFLDGFFEQVLSRVGAHVFVICGKGHSGEPADLSSNPFDINCPGYVFAAMADEYAYS